MTTPNPPAPTPARPTLYEIINPSDDYTCLGHDPKIVEAAIFLVGRGKYGLQDEHGRNDFCTLTLFYSEEKMTEHIAEMFGPGEDAIRTFVTAHCEELCAVLDSVMIMPMKQRWAYEEALTLMTPEAAKEYRARVYDRNRTSMNRFGERCWEQAEHWRQHFGTPQPQPADAQ